MDILQVLASGRDVIKHVLIGCILCVCMHVLFNGGRGLLGWRRPGGYWMRELE